MPKKELCGNLGTEQGLVGGWERRGGSWHQAQATSPFLVDDLGSLCVAKQQAKLGTPTTKQSCQLPGKASFIEAHKHTERGVYTHAA